ncbi:MULTISPECIES: hypothetical protein [unclassified Pseudofrankia]|uniref:hypothetical protein n=1 Tax=unclassified Pseudofrankia TaxID=2994372 RepID=UPI0008D9AC0C|nr:MULTISPECIES: hypothetical protein [unclassified Pseudofrankia]MDT3445646.1 hypothetical protein [Pseudofrankia sp. BMG5.37]OHV51975.1 hypothetical protein BCD48_45050 [Pseudofrankia sp. BMG5.36]
MITTTWPARDLESERAARRALTGLRVADAMLREPELHGPGTTVGQLREFFEDDHVHAAVVVDAGRRLLAVVERADLAAGGPARDLATTAGRCEGRTVAASADLITVWEAARAAGRRRLAVVDEAGTLLGLLALKRTGLGFCSEADVLARREDRPK